MKTIFVIALMIVIFFAYFNINNETSGNTGKEESENFLIRNVYPRYCSQCGGLGYHNCGSCQNCGYCISPSGTSQCVDGDINGPYFRKDCSSWYYNNILPVTHMYPYRRRYPSYRRQRRYPRRTRTRSRRSNK